MDQHTVSSVTMMQLSSMSPEAARLLIAQDVLDLLQEGSIKPQRNRYIELDHGAPMFPIDAAPESPAHFVVERWLTMRCSVCALGAAMLAAVRRFDALTVRDLDEYREPIVAYLERFFSREQLDLVEIAYERHLPIRKLYIANYEEALVERARTFCVGRTNEDALKMIFENVIANNGTFTP